MLTRKLVLLLGASCMFTATLAVSAYGSTRARLAVDGFAKVIRHSYPRSQLRLHGQILDQSGNPASYVGVQVTATSMAGGLAAVYGTVADQAGRYSVTVPRGPSRVIVVSAGGATRIIRELVAPYVWITVHPLGHGSILFTGGVKMDRSTAPPTVVIQDRPPHRPWQTFAAAVPNAGSHLYRYLYRHAPAGALGLTLAFRATSLPTAAWRPGHGDSKEATVR